MRKTKDELKALLENKKLQQYLDKLAEKYRGKRILGYGAGLLAEIILDNYDTSKLNIIGFSDYKFSSNEEDFRNFKAFSPDQIEEINPDVILLFVYDDVDIKEFFEDNYPEIKIPLIPIIYRNFLEKIKSVFFED